MWQPLGQLPRVAVQKIVRDSWQDDFADILKETFGIGEAAAQEQASIHVHRNLDEGGDLMEIDANLYFLTLLSDGWEYEDWQGPQ